MSGGVIAIAVLLVLALAVAAAFELQYRRRPGNELAMTLGTWELPIYEPQHYQLVGKLELQNQTQTLEIMVPQIAAEATLLSSGDLSGVTHRVMVQPHHADAESRPDGYWFAYIVKVGKTTGLTVTVDIYGEDLRSLKSAWIKISYLTYGPQGRIPKVQHVVVPLAFPDRDRPLSSRTTPAGEVFAIPTHLLTPLDDPVEVVKRYVAPHAKPNDIVTIGETPLAIMQERLRHPSTIKPGWLAKRLCYYFLPTSSLATACGLQSLVDIVGAWRVLFAFVGGAVLKVFGSPGGFYRLAGDQARLIDDVTGTLPPYDQFIVLGPDHPQQVVEQIKRETGLSAAIVDVNDLRAVKVLAASADLSESLLRQALMTNPAGNADEQTPIVLIRPKASNP
ncbi:MAG: F420-0:Gamma-glutamyl ligase [Cyanobacteria bacterium P01_A01_bin.135]